MERKLTDFLNSPPKKNNGLTREELERVTKIGGDLLRKKKEVSV